MCLVQGVVRLDNKVPHTGVVYPPIQVWKIHNMISDMGSNLIPKELNSRIAINGEEKRLLDLVHNQAPVRGQFGNTVESRIKLVKQYAREMINKVKGQKFEPISLTQMNYIIASALDEINSTPLLKNKK